MGHAFHSEPTRHRAPAPWRRRPQRRWARVNDHMSMATLLAVLPSLPRATLSRLTTRMIDRMDELDGDPDAEITGEDDEDPHDAGQEQAHD